MSPVIICNTKGNFINFFSEEDRKPAASATLAPHVKAAILVFVPAAKTAGGLPWRVFVIEDSDKNFPDGGAFVANFHVQDIRFTIGKTKEQLHPGAFHGVARPEPRDAFNMAPVVFEFQQDKAWRTASESKLRFVPGLRYLIFAYVDPVSQRPRICSLQDIKPYIPKIAPKDAPKVAPR